MSNSNSVTKNFHIGDILSITTGVLCFPNLMRGVYDILNFMSNDSLSTVQLGRVADEAKPYLLEQFPWLKSITKDQVAGKTNAQRIDELSKIHGEYHAVRPMHLEDHEQLSEIEDIKRIRPDAQVIGPIDLTPDESSPYGDISWKPSNKPGQ